MRPVLLACLLAGCATSGGFEKTMNTYVGVPEWSLIQDMGPPTSVYDVGDGSKIISYSRSGNMVVGGGTQIQPVTSNTRGTLTGPYGGQTTYNGTTTMYQQVQQPAYNVPLSCTVNFIVAGGASRGGARRATTARTSHPASECAPRKQAPTFDWRVEASGEGRLGVASDAVVM
jgi:hypothetical protein